MAGALGAPVVSSNFISLFPVIFKRFVYYVVHGMPAFLNRLVKTTKWEIKNSRFHGLPAS